MIKMILATDEKGALGLGGKLPWYCKEDLEYFKEQTLNRVCVMGSTTYTSLPFKNGLPNRYNWVLSSNITKSSLFEPVSYHLSVEKVIETYQMLEGIFIQDMFVCGGKSVYKQLLPYVQEIHHTVIKGEYLADTYMDMSFLSDWNLVETKGLSDIATVNIWRRE